MRSSVKEPVLLAMLRTTSPMTSFTMKYLSNKPSRNSLPSNLATIVGGSMISPKLRSLEVLNKKANFAPSRYWSDVNGPARVLNDNVPREGNIRWTEAEALDVLDDHQA